MFTGIVEEVGTVNKISPRKDLVILEIEAKKILEDVQRGDSIAVDGVCLTLSEKKPKTLVFEVMNYTLKNTTLGYLKVMQKVNLERSLKIQDRISGHFVLGHIDCIGLIRKRAYQGGNLYFEILIPKESMKYCLPKGSVAVDGISLTIAKTTAYTFTVYILPCTLENTTLFYKNPSSKVNIEFDILAKAVLNIKK
ncbi:MAG: riboflavin synthase [Candidatus Omnitrophica bacterium]|nr:riboflavin synthase [Candidatus Omnitrophota bacterium]MCM8799332.1 riboflavin synthase [Candidatus Omnitrophota bacterium]